MASLKSGNREAYTSGERRACGRPLPWLSPLCGRFFVVSLDIAVALVRTHACLLPRALHHGAAVFVRV